MVTELSSVEPSEVPSPSKPTVPAPGIEHQIAAIFAGGLKNDNDWSELEPELLMADPLLVGDTKKLEKLQNGYLEARTRVRNLKLDRSREN